MGRCLKVGISEDELLLLLNICQSLSSLRVVITFDDPFLVDRQKVLIVPHPFHSPVRFENERNQRPMSLTTNLQLRYTESVRSKWTEEISEEVVIERVVVRDRERSEVSEESRRESNGRQAGYRQRMWETLEDWLRIVVVRSSRLEGDLWQNIEETLSISTQISFFSKRRDSQIQVLRR